MEGYHCDILHTVKCAPALKGGAAKESGAGEELESGK